MFKKVVVILVILLSNFSFSQSLPEGFVYLSEVIPDIEIELRYLGSHNFTGRPVPGYENEKIILSENAAEALRKIQQELENEGYCLKIFDAYRPQQAVDSFISWSKNAEDTLTKTEFYPNKKKRNLFSLGYIATKSGHSRGSTVDLTLINANTLKELDMGGNYDYFGERSHHNFEDITKKQRENREYLKSIMNKYGFRSYSEEWWHYTFRNEPFPETYFNFPVK
ncbi:M15 family metallopeptidase [Zunongwangia endophytica]|uniref:D-alanyl-D-alanine dipeptidase n=1 Tax=Zunongwangia endophytica TaxID=1808945 RepID=A0ABV8H8Y4_9FLAO|nr:M15 family metallopeptidase [Zunongwangia endophytica]MDN3595272.1 M15 family metallopeptidase [Zunongwangia endophytica]